MSDFDPDWPHGHVTRDGRKARIICRDKRSSVGLLLVVNVVNDGYEGTWSYNQDGTFHGGSPADSYNLRNAPAPKRKFEFWVNVYPQDFFCYVSKKHADMMADDNRLACVHVTCEEGEGL